MRATKGVQLVQKMNHSFDLKLICPLVALLANSIAKCASFLANCKAPAAELVLLKRDFGLPRAFIEGKYPGTNNEPYPLGAYMSQLSKYRVLLLCFVASAPRPLTKPSVNHNRQRALQEAADAPRVACTPYRQQGRLALPSKATQQNTET